MLFHAGCDLTAQRANLVYSFNGQPRDAGVHAQLGPLFQAQSLWSHWLAFRGVPAAKQQQQQES
jgi:hypothetical protein